MLRFKKILFYTVILTLTFAVSANVYGQTRKKRLAEDEKARPAEMKVESAQIKTDSKSMEKRDAAITQLTELIKDYPEGKAKAGVYRRLAELYWEKARSVKAVVMADYDKKTDKYYEMNNPNAPMPELDLKAAWTWNNKAIDICELILKKYPDFENLDEVYFFMASNLMEVGQPLKAVRYYKLVVEKFKKSRYSADAYYQMGEYFFNNNNVFKAMPNYKAIVDEFKADKFYGYAMYKYAWCLYNVGEYEKSIQAFQDVVNYSNSNKKVELKEDALKDMVRPYAEAAGVDAAEKYFKNIVKEQKYFIMVLIKLAAIYDEQDRTEDSVKVYRKLLIEAPVDREAPRWQKQIVESYKKQNKKDNVREEVLVLVKNYADPNSRWVQANKKEESDITSAGQTAEFNLKMLLVEYHTEARKTNGEKTWAIVGELYPLYLKYFSKSESAYDMRFNYAEMLYDTKKFIEAGDQYQLVADANTKGSHFEDASYGSVACFSALLEKDQKAAKEQAKQRLNQNKESKKIEAGKVHVAGTEVKTVARKPELEKKTMPPLHQKFIKATETYVKNIPHSKYLVDIIYKQAITYYMFNHFEQAVPSFELIVQKYPRDDLAEYSANLIMDSLNITEDWEAISEKARTFLRNNALMSGRPTLKADFEKYKEMATFYAAEVPARKGKPLESAERYLAFVTEFPSSEYNDVSLYNAMTYYVNGGDIFQAIRIQERFLSENNKIYQKSKLREDVMFKLAKNYSAIAYYDKSAKLYLDFVEKAPTHKNAGDAVHDAAIYFEKMNDTEKAIDNYRLYVEKYAKDDKEKSQIALQYGYIWMRKGKTFYDKAIKGFAKYIAEYTDIKGLKDFVFISESGAKKDGSAAQDVEITKGSSNDLFALYAALIKIAEDSDNKKEYYKNLDIVLQIYRKGQWKEKNAEFNEFARDVIAKAMLVELEPEFNASMAINFDVKIKKLKWDTMDYEKPAPEYKKEMDAFNDETTKRLTQKANSLVELEKKYTDVIAQTKSPRFTPAVLYYIGMIYKDMTDKMFEAPLPPWFNENQKIAYKNMLDEKALKAQQKSVEAFEKAMYKGYETSVYNEWIMKAKGMLKYFQDNTGGKYYDENEIVPASDAIEISSYLGRIDIDIKFNEKGAKEEVKESPAKAEDKKTSDK